MSDSYKTARPFRRSLILEGGNPMWMMLIMLTFPTWMTGTWTSTAAGVQMEEHWTTAAGGLMLGLHRDVRGEKASFEFLRIESRDGRLAYVAQPSGRPPTRFEAASSARNRIVFENLQHDFPQRIIYWRDGDRLCARVESADGKNGEDFCWIRSPETAR